MTTPSPDPAAGGPDKPDTQKGPQPVTTRLNPDEIPDSTVDLIAELANRVHDGDADGAADLIAALPVDDAHRAVLAAVMAWVGSDLGAGELLEAEPATRFVELPDVRTWVRSDLIGGVRVVTTPDSQSDVVLVLAASASGEELGRIRVNAGDGEEVARRLLAEAQG